MTIQTILPIDLKKTDVECNSFVIDVSQTNWFFFKNNIDNIFIYIRNLDLQYGKLSLDFSKCDFFLVEKFLLQYVHSKIHVDIKTLNDMWSAIILQYFQSSIDMYSKNISVSYCQSFISNNVNTVEAILTILHSTMHICADTVCNKASAKYEHRNCTLSGNSLNILHDVDQFDILLLKHKCQLTYYDNMLNNQTLSKAFNMIKHTLFMTLSYGMTTTQWNDFCKLYDFLVKTNT